MSSGMNVEQAKELASKRNYKWAVGNLEYAFKGVAYKKATTILLHELAEIADRLVQCKDCKRAFDAEGEIICNHLSGMVGLNVVVKADDFCSYGERIENEKPRTMLDCYKCKNYERESCAVCHYEERIDE